MKRAPRRTAHGFSLLEIVIVLAIIAVAAALAFPAIREAMQKRREEAIAAKAEILVEKARDRARTRLHCTYVTYGVACGGASGSAGSAGIGVGEFGAGGSAGALALSTFEYPCDQPANAFTVRDLYLDASEATVSIPGGSIRFDPSGASIDATGAMVPDRQRIELQFASGSKRNIEVQPAAGTVRRR